MLGNYRPASQEKKRIKKRHCASRAPDTTVLPERMLCGKERESEREIVNVCVNCVCVCVCVCACVRVCVCV